MSDMIIRQKSSFSGQMCQISYQRTAGLREAFLIDLSNDI